MARTALITGILGIALWTGAGAAAEVQRFHLSQAQVELPDVTVYADILDAAGGVAPAAQPVRLSGTLGGRALKLASLTPFEKTGEGVAYIFVVDTSESIAPARFDTIREAIEGWVKSVAPKDRVAIIGFSEKVHVLADFNDGKERALTAARQLVRAGKTSLIHRALADAVELSSRRDAGLPARRAIVIVTDGKDEGSGLKADDVLERASAAHVPIYALGYSNLPRPERRQYLDELHRIAEKSGGDYLEVADKGLTEAFTGMKSAIRRVFVAAFTCRDCETDSKARRLELQLEARQRVFSEGFDVVSAPKPPARQEGTRAPWWKRPWWVYAGAGLALVLFTGGLVLWRRKAARARRSLAANTPLPAITNSGSAGSDDLPMFQSGKPAATQPAGAPEAGRPSVRVQFTVVRGRERGAVSEMRLVSNGGSENGLVIGRRSACDLALSDDETVSNEHCQLLWVNRKLVIRDLHSSNGTLVNGVPIIGDQPLENGDRVGIGKTEYRVGVVPDSL
jgi:VWFA-related protein